MILALHAPESAFTLNLSGPGYLVPLCVLGFFFMILSSAQVPIQLQWLQSQMETSGLPEEEVAANLELMRKTASLAPILVPLFLLLRWASFSLLLWMTAQVMLLPMVGYQGTLNIVAYAYPPILLRDAAAYLVLCLRGDAVLERSDGLYVPLGLNLILPFPHPWSVLIGSVNAFEAWYVMLLSVGISKLTGTRLPRAIGVVLPCWLLVVFLQFGLAWIGTSLRQQSVPGFQPN